MGGRTLSLEKFSSAFHDPSQRQILRGYKVVFLKTGAFTCEGRKRKGVREREKKTIRVSFNHRFICNENAVELAGMMNGNNYVSSCSCLVFSRSLFFLYIHFIIFAEIEKGEKYVSSGRKYSQSHLCTIAAKKSLWRSRNKFLGNCLRRGGKKSNQVNVAVLFQDTF